MKFNYLTTKISYLAVLALLFSLASCGSYEYVGHDNDGIYGSDNRNVEYQTEKETVVETTENGNYYKNYFSEKSREYENMSQNGEIFTDIDSYQGEYDEAVIDTLQYENAYAGWGQNNDDVTINIYNRGYNYWGFSPFYLYGWSYSSFGFYNYHFSSPYYYSPFYYGHNYPFYYYGNYGYGYPFYYGHHYPYNYGNSYFSYYQNNPYGYAYNRGRRGSLLNRNLSSTLRRNSINTRPRSTNPRTI